LAGCGHRSLDVGDIAINAADECSDTILDLVGRVAAGALNAIRDDDDCTPQQHAGYTCSVRSGFCRKFSASGAGNNSSGHIASGTFV
jgi:hypothetical protein